MPGDDRPDTDQLAQSDDGAEVGLRFALLFTAAVALALATAVLGLDRTGISARDVRSGSTEVVIVNDSEELLSEWEEAGVHGAVLVDATRDLGYRNVSEGAWAHLGPAEWPVPHQDLRVALRKSSDRSTALWVASKTGLLRSITYILPASELEQKVQAGREAGYPGISPDGRRIDANDNGFLRTLLAQSPDDVPDAAILNVDASYFVTGSPEELSRQLEATLDHYRLITLNRAQDATDVPEAAREQLESMAVRLQGGGQ